MVEEPLSSEDVFVIDENARFLGLDTIVLMENAGRGVADEVEKIAVEKRARKVVVVTGLGNNGGDGFVAARHLAGRGFDVTVILAGPRSLIRTKEARANFDILTRMSYSIKIFECKNASDVEAACRVIRDADIIVDALLGTGIRGSVREPYRTLIQAINEAKGVKVAVDIPSGLSADTGEILGVCVQADVTVTFHRVKKGIVLNPRPCGKIVVKSIGVPPEAEKIVGLGDLKVVLRRRPPESKKGDFGRILVIGGSREYSGAPALAALAALRAGADIVIVVAPEAVASVIRSFSPNLIVREYPGTHFNAQGLEVVKSLLSRATCLLLGPGLSLEEEALECSLNLLDSISSDFPVVIDADGLKAVARNLDVVREKNVVLTPHAGEYKILFGEAPPRDYEERMEHVRRKAREYGVTILLKGHRDVVSDGVRVKVNHTGNPAMTVGGTGDVLAGITATFFSWTRDGFKAACTAAFLNGLVGDFVARAKGAHILASDLIDAMPSIIAKIVKEVDLWEPSEELIQQIDLNPTSFSK